VIVLGIDTATPQTSVALGTERGTLAQMALTTGPRSHEEIVAPAIEHLLTWSEFETGRDASHVELEKILAALVPALAA